jgi:hypothetical protein
LDTLRGIKEAGCGEGGKDFNVMIVNGIPMDMPQGKRLDLFTGLSGSIHANISYEDKLCFVESSSALTRWLDY